MAVFGTDEEWVAKCKEQIDILGKGDGYMLATGCEYPSGADFKRAELMVDIAKTYNPHH
jgi:uroporphyrinogen decarboxylase